MHTFILERMIENGKWIRWGFRKGTLSSVLNDLANSLTPDALESLRVKRVS